MKNGFEIDDIINAKEKCEKGFTYFDKKYTFYNYDIGCYMTQGDNEWHYWQGTPEHLLMSPKCFEDLK